MTASTTNRSRLRPWSSVPPSIATRSAIPAARARSRCRCPDRPGWRTGSAATPASVAHDEPGRPVGVLERVGERLLHDPVRRHVDAARRAASSGRSSSRVHLESRCPGTPPPAPGTSADAGRRTQPSSSASSRIRCSSRPVSPSARRPVSATDVQQLTRPGPGRCAPGPGPPRSAPPSRSPSGRSRRAARGRSGPARRAPPGRAAAGTAGPAARTGRPACALTRPNTIRRDRQRQDEDHVGPVVVTRVEAEVGEAPAQRQHQRDQASPPQSEVAAEAVDAERRRRRSALRRRPSGCRSAGWPSAPRPSTGTAIAGGTAEDQRPAAATASNPTEAIQPSVPSVASSTAPRASRRGAARTSSRRSRRRPSSEVGTVEAARGVKPRGGGRTDPRATTYRRRRPRRSGSPNPTEEETCSMDTSDRSAGSPG